MIAGCEVISFLLVKRTHNIIEKSAILAFFRWHSESDPSIWSVSEGVR